MKISISLCQSARLPERVADGHALNGALRAWGVTSAYAFVAELAIAFK